MSDAAHAFSTLRLQRVMTLGLLQFDHSIRNTCTQYAIKFDIQIRFRLQIFELTGESAGGAAVRGGNSARNHTSLGTSS